MDYNEMLEQHIHTNADVTISVVNVPWSEANRFGIVTSDKSDRIIEFEEKNQSIQSLIKHRWESIFSNVRLYKCFFGAR
ncbi:hypothetical protein GCM10020331_069860 [Ectobacillus funiculus]